MTPIRALIAKRWVIGLLVLAAGIAVYLAVKPPATEAPILQAVSRLAGNPAAHAQALGELRAQLSQMPPAQAAAGIRKFLATGADQPTGGEFVVGRDGGLKSAPTLRVFLLDHLAQMDPAAAADQARLVLSQTNSADEWAVCLRNLARQSRRAEDKDFLERKFRELTAHEAWQRNPSAGFLEAFDLPVYLGRTNLVPDLAGLLKKQDNQAVAHAAFLALDRLVIANPADTLAMLQSAPELMAGREVTRANYFARADVQDARQRQILESYLLSASLPAVELEKFAGLYPNANYMVSDNLLTKTETPASGMLAQRDAAALAVVNQWLQDSRFESRRPQLLVIQKRLAEFVRQAGQ